MAKLEYASDGRLLFTKEMKAEYTVLMPQMIPITFSIIKRILEKYGYKAELLTTTHRGIVDTGLKYVHNDICYPALLVIGQFLEALNSGKYDRHKVALFISQTGGGCRASNYIHLLRKALHRAGYDDVPVVSLNLSGFERNPGFSVDLRMMRMLIAGVLYGDLLMWLKNQCLPYEISVGDSSAITDQWVEKLAAMLSDGKGMSKAEMRRTMKQIVVDYASIQRQQEKKPRVGIVGEIYVKYAPLGNNNLEQFLLDEGCEPIVPGLTNFIIFKLNNRVVDVDLYGGKRVKKIVVGMLQRYIEGLQQVMVETIQRNSSFHPMGTFKDLQQLIKGYLGYGNKMGEGWLLAAEMLELIHDGTNNIVCTQPFGCLPNHVVGKGMFRVLKDDYPASNIVAIDYDAGATKINQENRIKLMLANAALFNKQTVHGGSFIDRKGR